MKLKHFLKPIGRLSLPLLLFCLLYMPHGFCSKTYEVTEEQLTTLEQNLTILQQNNNELKNLLNQSATDLTTANQQSDELNNQIAQLNQQLLESQNQISTLQNQLAALKQQTAEAKNSLKTANEELAKASASFKVSEKEHERTESRLRQQKTLWQVLACGALIYTTSK